MAEFSDILSQVDSTLATFDSAALKAQKKLMEQVMLLSKELDVDSSGNIKTTIANLQKIAKIKAAISKIVCSDKYKDAVTKLCEDFEKVYNKQATFYKNNFQAGTIGETAAKKQKLLQQMAVQNTIEGLTGAGVNAQITDKLSDMLSRSVTSGALWTDMVAEMKAYLDPDGDGTGAFAKYAKTYATTAMGQFTGQNNKLMTDALDTEWYMYVGSEIDTTREFCQHLTKKRYIHVSEIPTILQGHIDGHDCAIYEKTGLPQGMIEGTTPENFQVNVGGWNCRHQLLPVAEEAVPADIRAKFDSVKLKQKEEEARIKAEKERRISATKRIADSYLDDFKNVKGADTSALEDAYKQGRWDDVRLEALKLAKIKRSILEHSIHAMKNGAEFGEIDTSKLKSFFDAGNIADMATEARNVEKLIAKTKAAEEAISNLIPNAHDLHHTYTMADLESAHSELDGVMKRWLSKYRYSSIDNAPLEHLKNKLDFELTNPSVRYSNTEIIKKAIKEKINIIEKQIAWNNLVEKAQSLKSFTTKSSIYKDTLKKIDAAINSNDSNALQDAINEATKKQKDLLEKQIKRGGDTKTALNKEYKGSVTGKDLTSSFDARKIIATDQYYGENRYTNDIARMQGFDAPAKLVSVAEFENLEKACGEVFFRTLSPTTFRGKDMSSKEFASQYYKADLMDMNGGGERYHGDGIYVATSSWNGNRLIPVTTDSRKKAYNGSYCYGHDNPTILEMTFIRPPKVIKHTELYAMWRKLTPEQRKKYGDHENTYACALGYDAMLCSGVNYMVIWNRSIIAVKKQ